VLLSSTALLVARVGQPVWCLHMNWLTKVWTVAGAKDFYSGLCIRISCRASLSMGYQGFFPQGWSMAVVCCWPLTPT
jgi:hypothetical protein